MPEASGKIESEKNDAAELARVLEMELAAKRAAWQRASSRYRAIRTFGYLLLVIIVAGVIAALLFVFSRVNEERASQPETTPATENR